MAKLAAVAAFAGLLGTSTAFAPTGIALRGSHAVPSISQRPQVGSGVLASRRLLVDAAGAGRRTSASFGALKMSANVEEEEDIEKIAFLEIPKNFDPKAKSMDEWFEQVRGDFPLGGSMFSVSSLEEEEEEEKRKREKKGGEGDGEGEGRREREREREGERKRKRRS